MKAWFVIKANGEITKTVMPKNPPYEVWKEACGGIVQQVPYFTKLVYQGKQYTRGTLFVNEEGIIRGMPVNDTLTRAWRLQYPYATVLHGDGIYYATEKE